MTENDVKKKYLRRAQHLIQRDNRSTKRKLQASVEPISSTRTAKHSAEKWHGGSDSCSDSDTLSRRSSLDPQTSLPPLELKAMLPSLPTPTVRPSPTFQHKLPTRTPFTSLSVHYPRQTSCDYSSSPPSQRSKVEPSELESQLRMQTDVNRELKRLLVASVGSDLEHRLQQIVQEKAELSQDLDLSLQQVMDNYEELDQVSIECDIWRSKFIASRVMIDELASWKAELSLQLRESRKALQYMMHERGDICYELRECSAHLQRGLLQIERLAHRPHLHHGRGLLQIERLAHRPHSHHVTSNTTNVATVSPVQYCSTGGNFGESRAVTTALDLARSNTVTARDLTLQLRRVTAGQSEDERFIPTGVPPPCAVDPTPGERLTQRVLNYRGESQRTRETSPPLPKLLLTDEDLVHHRATPASSLSRRLFHFGAKALEDPFRVPFHCTKCKGKIFIV